MHLSDFVYTDTTLFVKLYMPLVIHMNECLQSLFGVLNTQMFVALFKDIVCTQHSRNNYLQGLIVDTWISNIACQFNSVFYLSDLRDIIIDRTR